MTEKQIMMLPPIGLLGVVGYLLYPIVMQEVALAQADDEVLPILDARQLQPELPPPAPRNPFQVGGELKRARDRELAEAQAGPPVKPPEGLRLGATMITGKSRYAVIDGKTYTLNERVAVPDRKDETWHLVMIERDRVVLHGVGHDVYATLDYSQPERKAPPPEAVSGPGAMPAELVQSLLGSLIRDSLMNGSQALPGIGGLGGRPPAPGPGGRPGANGGGLGEVLQQFDVQGNRIRQLESIERQIRN